jgi:hypothetical protein
MPATFTCEQCGATFTRAHINRPGIRFCSRSCKASARTGDANPNWKGGMTKHPLYGSYVGLVERCTYPGHKDYALYGGRGITVCDRWLDDFWAFVEDMGERPEGHSLDRVDCDGPYAPENCRWATASEQRINQRRNKTSGKAA